MKIDNYELNHPDQIDTPAMITYRHIVEQNISEIINLAGGASRIVPHAKTHKSSDVLKMQIDSGIKSFKCATLNEAEMVARAGAEEIVMAYPLMHPMKLDRLDALISESPGITIRCIVSMEAHLKKLSDVMVRSGNEIGVYMDLDTGMRRTGVQPGDEANIFYEKIFQYKNINPIGVHVFDGETLYLEDSLLRKDMVESNFIKMESIWNHSAKRGIPVTDNLAGGSWSFRYYLGKDNVRATPGTWIYWDSRNAQIDDLNFQIASLILGQVVDEDPEMDTVTLDIGSKASSSDQPLEHRFKVVGCPNAIVVAQSEEHGVVKLNGDILKVGDYVLAAPGHACTMTVKFPFTHVVSNKGDVVGRFNHDARDR